MIRSGDTLQNPVTGETVHVVRSASETEGEYVLVEVRVEPDGFVAAAHIHPYQTEVFEILEGEVGFKADGKTIIAGPGETLVVEPGTAHASGTTGTPPLASGARCAPRSSSRSCSPRCTRSQATARRTARACRTRSASR
jgi:quercetin dioxygenase-like cupin family protein